MIKKIVNKNKKILKISLLFLVLSFCYVVFAQNQRVTVFNTQNKGYLFKTNSDNNLKFEVSYDNYSPYISFGYINPRNQQGNYITNINKFSIRNTLPAIFFYSESPVSYGTKSIVMKFTTNTLEIRKAGPRQENYPYLANVEADLSDLIAIYACSYGWWLSNTDARGQSATAGTCLGKPGFYSNRIQPPPGVVNNINPTTCFGDNSGYVLIDMCPDDCGYRLDDFGMTICIKNKY
jgi:hypothetical protein